MTVHRPEPAAGVCAELRLTPAASSQDALRVIADTAVDRVPGVEWASITGRQGKGFRTLVPTDERAKAVDDIQYELDDGPCVTAVRQGTTVRVGDLRAESRWAELGRRAARTGVRSMLSLRLPLPAEDDLVAGLNLYSTRTEAFDHAAEVRGGVLAAHGAAAVSAAAARERADQLQRALQSSREIGIAIGVLMSTYRIDRARAFELLRLVSQNANRKLADVAVEVGDTGALELPRTANARERATAILGTTTKPRPTAR